MKSPNIFFFGPSARKSRGSQNCPKRSFFGLKNVKNFESGIQYFFSQKIFILPRRAKMHFALKSTFSKETAQQRKYPKIPKIPQNSEIFLSCQTQKKCRRRLLPRRLRRLFFLLFFFLTENQIPKGKI